MDLGLCLLLDFAGHVLVKAEIGRRLRTINLLERWSSSKQPLSTAAGSLQSPSSASLSERSLPSKASSSRSTHWSHLRFRKAAWMLSLTQTWPRLANSSNRICSRALKLCRPHLSSRPQQQANLFSVPAAANAPNHGSEKQAMQELAKLSKKACCVHLSGFGSSFTRSLTAVHSIQREPRRVSILQRRPSPDLLQLPWFRTRPFSIRLLGSASPRSHCMIA